MARCLIQWRKPGSRLAVMLAGLICANSSQAALRLSHTSGVSAVRTARPLLRAVRGRSGRTRGCSRRTADVDDVCCRHLIVLGEIARLAGRLLRSNAIRRVALDRARHQRDAIADLEQPRHVLRPLDIARQPEEDAAVRPSIGQSSSTQVSLVPPPWLELTTSDPFFSATRVRPPGVMRMRSPART